MKKLILILAICAFTGPAFSQQIASSGKSEFMFIIRFKSDFQPPSDEAVKTNIKKWQAYMGDLAKSGDLVAGYRPASGGLTISGTGKTLKTEPDVSDGMQISSVIVIKAISLDAAKDIADKCPVFEFGGSIEVRPVTEAAGH